MWTYPEEQVKEEEQILDTFVHSHGFFPFSSDFSPVAVAVAVSPSDAEQTDSSSGTDNIHQPAPPVSPHIWLLPLFGVSRPFSLSLLPLFCLHLSTGFLPF